MTDFREIFVAFTSSPLCCFAVLSAVTLMLVNGWTDAPVNIATAIHSGATGPRSAVVLSAVCNFLGAGIMAFFGSSVAVSLYSISGLGAVKSHALTAVTASFVSVVLWALFALRFGLPTSESHALMAALSGSAVAVQGLSAINGIEWLKALLGILLSTVPVSVAAFFTAVVLKKQSALPDSTFKKLQVIGAALSSFSHGAQDGQKLAGVLALTAVLCANGQTDTVKVPLWTVLTSAFVISLGTLLGGRKIIKKFKEFAPVDSKSGFGSDLVSAVSLGVLAVLGLPASTTHAKSSAVFGAGLIDRRLSEQVQSFKSMVAVWLLTFPVTAILGFLLTKIFVQAGFECSP